MGGFETTLITAIVASVVSVLAFLGLTLVVALYWSSIARKIAPNRFAEPESEKAWPSSKSFETGSSVISGSPRSSPSPPSSPRSSRTANADPVMLRAILKN